MPRPVQAAALVGVEVRVGHQVGEHLAQARGVGQDPRRVGGDLDVELLALGLDAPAQQRRDVLQHLADVDRPTVDLDAPGL